MPKDSRYPYGRPWAVCEVFKQMWEERFPGETFYILSMHLKYSKEIDSVPMDEIARRLRLYFSNDFYLCCNFSLQAFVKNFEKFVESPEEKKIKARREYMKELEICPNCDTRYLKSRGHTCPTLGPPVDHSKDVTSALKILTEKWKA